VANLDARISTGSGLYLEHHVFYNGFQIVYEFRVASGA
jgi:hypothetical protein